MRIAVISLLVLVCAVCGGFTSAYAQQTPKIRLLSPKKGDQLKPGQKVMIVWDAQIPTDIDLAYCEQEIFLSVDGGKTIKYRLTPRLSPTVRSFEWTVPNIPTGQAVLDVRFGSEKDVARFEHSKPQKQARFRILRAEVSSAEAVELANQGTYEAVAGEDIDLQWTSSVAAVDHFEVLISYDQGAHFHTIGTTGDHHFNWRVPADLTGFATFQIIAHKQDGAQVRSVVAAQPQLLVK